MQNLYVNSLDKFLRFERFLINTYNDQVRSLGKPILLNKDTMVQIRRTIESDGKVLASILNVDEVYFIKLNQSKYNENFI